MRTMTEKWGKTAAPKIRNGWRNHRTTLLRIAIVFMLLFAVFKLGNGFYRLVWDSGKNGAIDLRIRHREVHAWFSGMPVYREIGSAVYPPASYAILWPVLGWLGKPSARWLWAATSMAALGWLACLVIRGSGATTPLERAFVGLSPFSILATGVTIGNGQLILHLLPILVTGLLLLHRGPRGWLESLLSVALILISLVSPTISAPFFWMVLFVSSTLLPALLISFGYVALTLLAASFQAFEPVSLLHIWIQMGLGGAVSGSTTGGYANLHSALAAINLQKWNLPASLFMLVALGFWTYRYRHGDVWVLLGVAALVARFWTYHRLYDNLLILLPGVALFRIAKRGPHPDGCDVTAGVLLAMTWVMMLGPPRLSIIGPFWDSLFRTGQAILWILVLIFLLDWAQREKKGALNKGMTEARPAG